MLTVLLPPGGYRTAINVFVISYQVRDPNLTIRTKIGLLSIRKQTPFNRKLLWNFQHKKKSVIRSIFRSVSRSIEFNKSTDRPREDLKNSRKLWVTDFLHNRHMKVVRLSALLTGRLYPPTRCCWYSILLESESISGPQCGRKDHVNEKLKSQNRESNPRSAPLHTPRIRLRR